MYLKKEVLFDMQSYMKVKILRQENSYGRELLEENEQCTLQLNLISKEEKGGILICPPKSM